jgi:uncharacterized delta-60 repeat protein
MVHLRISQHQHHKHMKKFILLLILSIESFTNLSAQTVPDLSFGTNGQTVIDISQHDDAANAIIVQPDGKILIAGDGIPQSYSKFTLARFHADGIADTTFGNNGIAQAIVGPVNEHVTDLALQADGKILVAGYYGWNFYTEPAVVRFHSDGTIDSTFGIDGYARFVISNQFDDFHAIAIQQDGKILAAGRTFENNTYNFLVMRLHNDGSPDSTFSFDGKLTGDISGGNESISDLIIQPDGKIIIAGQSEPGASFIFAARFHQDGSPDPSFGINGISMPVTGARFDQCASAVQQIDSSIVLAGKHHQGAIDKYMFMRLKPNGSLDSTFATNGLLEIPTSDPSDVITDVSLTLTGKIIATGTSGGSNAMLMRITSSGVVDLNFGTNGIYSGNNGGSESRFNSIYLLSDSTFLAAGSVLINADADMLLARVITNTTTWMNENDPVVYPVTIYPNPSTGFIMLDLPYLENEKAGIYIYNSVGAMVYSTEMSIINSSARIDLPAGLATGNYIISLVSNNRRSSGSFIVK